MKDEVYWAYYNAIVARKRGNLSEYEALARKAYQLERAAKKEA